MKTGLGGERHPCVEPVVPNAVEPVMHPVPYARQHIGGLLGDRMDRNIANGLLGYPVEVYLNPYRTDWTARWPSGEYLGKYLQADVCMYQYSGSAELMEQLRNIIGTWLDVLPEDGYLVVRGPKETERWRGAWEVWELKYDLIGLLSFYSISGDERVLGAARRIGDLLCSTFGYGEGQRDMLEAGAHRSGSTSVLEPMTYLYRYTGDKRHLDFCEYIMKAHEQEPNGTKIISELTTGSGEVYGIGGPRMWQMGKAYEMISSFVGVVRMYELTGRREYRAAMLQAWKDIRDNRLFVTGTTSNREYFLHKHILPGEQADLVGEGCVTAHWVFFSRVLFGLTGDPQYIDEIETAVYNALIASQSPHNGYQSYFTPINGKRNFELHTIETPAPPCCISSVAREIARTAEAVWAKPRDGGVAVLLYSVGEFQDEVKAADGRSVDLSLEMQTDFPRSGRVTLTLKPERPATIKLLLRVPGWCTTYRASVGGKSYSGTPGQFLEVTRAWQKGDEVAIEMDVPVRLVPGGDSYPGHFALKRGPQVLAIDSRLNEGEIGAATIDSSVTVALVAAPERLPEGWVGDQAYLASAVTIGGKGPVVLVPYADAGQFGGHEYRVWIRDINAPAEHWSRIEDTSPDWRIAGESSRESHQDASGGSVTRVEGGGALEIEFTGSQVRVLGMKGPEQGLADIVIDGDLYRDVRWYEHRDTHQARILTSRLLMNVAQRSNGRHSSEDQGMPGRKTFAQCYFIARTSVDNGKHRMTITAKGRITLDCVEALTFEK